MGVIYDFIFDNSYQIDAEAVEKSTREKYPLLLHPEEKIVLAFKDRGGKGRDKEYFTTHRILIKDGKGVGSKRKNYQSIPYKYIQAFTVETAGKLDGDVSLKVYSTGVPLVEIDFAKANVDIYQLQQFLSMKVAFAANKGDQDDAPPTMEKKQFALGNVVDWFGDNAKKVSPATLEKTFKEDLPVLLKDEKVQIGYKSGRDYTVFTDRRVLLVDIMGVFGKKITFETILWKSVHSYSVQTQGSLLDRDMELKLFTNIIGLQSIEQDIRQQAKGDLFLVMRSLNNHILGEDTDPLPDVDKLPGHTDQKGFWWFRSNQRPLDAVEIDKQYHTNPQILRASEHVEMAFKGHRDITLFTNLRVIVIDPKGLIGKKTEYLTIPWKSIVAHAVRSSGKFLDFDQEVCFWTEKEFLPGKAGKEGDAENPPVPPEPYVSYFELDFNKKMVNLNELNYYLSRRLLLLNKVDPGAPIPMEHLTEQFERPSGFERMLQWIGGDNRELDPNKMDHELHTSTHILLDDEKVLMAFKAGRDTTLFTNLRFLSLDVKSILNKSKVQYTSIPYKSIYAWDVQTAGLWDRDTEMTLYTRNRWDLAKFTVDFRTGKADIAQINHFLSALIVGLPSDKMVNFAKKDYSSGKGEANPFPKGASFGILDNKWEIDAGPVEEKLRTDPCILLEEEKVLRAFQQGRDIDVFTNRRLIFINTKGLTGKRRSYKSIPYKYIHGYEFETAGHADRDAELYLHTDIAEVQQERFPRLVPALKTEQSLLTKKTDIYEMGKLFNDHILFSKDDYMEEPEFDISGM